VNRVKNYFNLIDADDFDEDEEENFTEKEKIKKAEKMAKLKLERENSKKFMFIYGSIFVTSFYLYLNFVKNPFN